MYTTNAIKQANFFILTASLSQSVELRVTELCLQARQLYYIRDFDRLDRAGKGLMGLSARGEEAGRYFSALANRHIGRNSQADAELRELAEIGSLTTRAATTLALGMQPFESGDLDEASRVFKNAHELCLASKGAPLTRIHVLNRISELYSIRGDHIGSLGLLRAIHYEVSEWGRVYPFLLGEQYNNVAYELFKLGELDAAHYTINKACAMPISKAYPEWYDTRCDIEEELSHKKSSALFVPADFHRQADVPNPRESRRKNIIPFTQKKVIVWVRYFSRTDIVKEFDLQEGIPNRDFLACLMHSIEQLQDISPTPILIVLQFLENGEVRDEQSFKVPLHQLNELQQRLLDFDTLQVISSLYVEEMADEEEVLNQTQKLLHMIEADEEARDVCVRIRMKTKRHTQILEELHANGQIAAEDLASRLSTILESLNDGDPDKLDISIIVEGSGQSLCSATGKISRSKIDDLYELFKELKTA